MLYLSYFAFPGSDREWEYRLRLKTTYHDTIYPFYVLPDRGMDEIFFKPVTILYGGNGSGKSTILNVIARRLGLERATPWNSSEHFDAFCDMCRYTTDEDIPEGSCIVTSDDVFDFMLNLRSVNEGVERSREDAAAEYFRLQHEKVTVRSLDDYDRLRKTVDARRKTLSRYIAGETGKGLREHSNGESADLYFRNKIQSDILCLLDEPENSLSPENQRQLAEYLETSVRYCGCQLVISTHSPFLLAIPGARIIDLDHGSRVDTDWTKLANVRTYYDFFKQHEKAFEED